MANMVKSGTSQRNYRIIVAMGAALISSQAHAATDTATLSVNATVQSGCSLSGGTLEFGNYTSGQVESLDATGTVSYANCSGFLSFELDGGQSGDVNARAMTGSGSELSYQLYSDLGRTNVFGLGADALELNLLIPLSGTVDVYGRIPGSQAVASGSYSDTINITLTF